MNSHGHLPNPKIRVEYELDGKTCVFEGTARFATLETEHNYDNVHSDQLLDSARIFKNSTTTTLTTELVDGWNVTVKEPVEKEVFHTATVEADDRTVEAIERARVLAGAPSNAKIRVGNAMNYYGSGELVVENLDEPNPIQVEFRWREGARGDW